ncbi:hypothetical protein J1605_010318 [Eschrichtius robustus]|uniref:Uncharacterized protein n=1 Tax=Eschrichtius robustus TaxID=9764 RepID=A0AB34GS65_ESCRO|nr:hypothetical protein J1605_010318 [Eschrichtius robustus]
MRLQLQPVTTRWRPASPEQEAERPQIARSMWTLGRRAAASLLPRSAPPGSAQARAGAPRPTKDPRLYGCRGLRTGTAAAGTPSQPVSIRAGSRPGRTPAWRGRARRGPAGHAHRLQLRLGKGGGGGGRRAFPSLSFSRLQLHWLPLSVFPPMSPMSQPGAALTESLNPGDSSKQAHTRHIVRWLQSLSLCCLNQILNVKKHWVCWMNLRTTGTLGDAG